MKIAKLMAAGAMTWAASVAGAHGATFTGSYSETYNTTSSGLHIATEALQAGSALAFSLSPGQSTTIDLYQIYTPETTVNGDDVVPKAISTLFDFTGANAFASSVDGMTVGVKDTDGYAFPGFAGNHQYGQVGWSDTDAIKLSDGSTLKISLNDAIFNEGEYYALNHGSFPYSGTAESNGAPITATFTLEGGASPVSSAPEPSTWALMLAGVALLGGALRHRRRDPGAIATAA